MAASTLAIAALPGGAADTAGTPDDARTGPADVGAGGAPGGSGGPASTREDSGHGEPAHAGPAPAGPAQERTALERTALEGPALEFAPFNDDAFLAAKKSGAPIGLYFEADWCAPCKEMHARTFRDPAVLEAAAGIRFFRVDMTRPDRYVELVEKSFHVLGAPTFVLFGPDGKESGRRFGFIPPDDFVKMLGDSRKPSPGT